MAKAWKALPMQLPLAQYNTNSNGNPNKRNHKIVDKIMHKNINPKKEKKIIVILLYIQKMKLLKKYYKIVTHLTWQDN